MAVLYSLAAITPDTEFGLSFYDYFTEEERFALWRVASLREYLPKMNSAPSRGLSIDMAKPLMRQLLGSAQEAVDGGEVCAAPPLRARRRHDAAERHSRSGRPLLRPGGFRTYCGDKISRTPDMKPLPEVATGY
ncbi:MAG: hypothetical protein ACLTSJ_05845 [Alistipes communis]